MQTIVVDLQTRLEAMHLTGSVVELPGNGVEVVLGVPGQVRALVQVLPQESVGVFVAAELPGAVRVGKNHRYAGQFRQALMLAHLLLPSRQR